MSRIIFSIPYKGYPLYLLSSNVFMQLFLKSISSISSFFKCLHRNQWYNTLFLQKKFLFLRRQASTLCGFYVALDFVPTFLATPFLLIILVSSWFDTIFRNSKKKNEAHMILTTLCIVNERKEHLILFVVRSNKYNSVLSRHIKCQEWQTNQWLFFEFMKRYY